MERNIFSLIRSFLRSHRQNLSRSFNFFSFFVLSFLIKIVEETVDLFKQLVVTSFVSKHNCLASHGELTETGTETQSACDQ